MKRGTRQTLGYRMLYRWVQYIFTRCYCRLYDVRGAVNVPSDQPVIFVTTHQNNLADALAVLFASRRRPVFVARADYFRHPLADRALRLLRMLPMYRADHGRDAIETRLPETMEQLRELLNTGGACAIMAEGSSVPSRSVRPLKKGWARLAMDVLPLKPNVAVIPVAIEYSDWTRWGPDARVTFGEPLKLSVPPEGDEARHLTEMNRHLRTMLASMVADDAHIEDWHQHISRQREKRDRLWRTGSIPALALTWLFLFPVLLAARWAVRRHPRADFRSTLEIGIVALGTPVWCLLIGLVSWALFGMAAFVGGAIALPVIFWAGARCHIAWSNG